MFFFLVSVLYQRQSLKTTCSECGRPFSVETVKIKLNGQKICGRCNAPNNPDMVLPALNYAYEAAVIGNRKLGFSAIRTPFNEHNSLPETPIRKSDSGRHPNNQANNFHIRFTKANHQRYVLIIQSALPPTPHTTCSDLHSR